MLVLKIYKAYKFRMYPNEEQATILNSFLGTKRFIYNNYLFKKPPLLHRGLQQEAL